MNLAPLQMFSASQDALEILERYWEKSLKLYNNDNEDKEFLYFTLLDLFMYIASAIHNRIVFSQKNFLDSSGKEFSEGNFISCISQSSSLVMYLIDVFFHKHRKDILKFPNDFLNEKTYDNVYDDFSELKNRKSVITRKKISDVEEILMLPYFVLIRNRVLLRWKTIGDNVYAEIEIMTKFFADSCQKRSNI